MPPERAQVRPKEAESNFLDECEKLAEGLTQLNRMGVPAVIPFAAANPALASMT